MNKLECYTQSAWMVQSFGVHTALNEFSTGYMPQHLRGHFVHTLSFNIFALFTRHFERLARLKFCSIEVIPCKRKSLHTRIFNRPKIRPVPCELRQYSLSNDVFERRKLTGSGLFATWGVILTKFSGKSSL